VSVVALARCNKRAIAIGIILCLAGSVHAAVIISPVNAVATANRLGSDAPGAAGSSGNTYNGSGFTGGVTVGQDPTDDSFTLWYVLAGDGISPPQTIYYDLGSSTSISSVYFWNNTWEAVGQITQIDVGYTTGTPGSFTLANMTGLSWTDVAVDAAVSGIGTGQQIGLSSTVSTRYVRLRLDSTTLASPPQNYWGFNEFAVSPDSVPEPSGLMMIGAVGILARRRCSSANRRAAQSSGISARAGGSD
jgi:hypothetical protein